MRKPKTTGHRAIKPQAADYILKEVNNAFHLNGQNAGSPHGQRSRLLSTCPPPCCLPTLILSALPIIHPSFSVFRKQTESKTKSKKAGENKTEKKNASQYFNTRENRGGTQSKKRLENVLNCPLASEMVLLHITRLAPEQENTLYPMATSVGWIIGILGGGNSGDVKGTNSKEEIRENTGMENKIKDQQEPEKDERKCKGKMVHLQN